MSKVITHDDVRMLLLDRTAQDNALDMDLTFTAEEIDAATSRMAAAYNEIHPRVHSLCLKNPIPYRHFFLHGIVWQLYLAALARIQRNRVAFTAGNAEVDPYRVRAEYYMNALNDHREEFITGARSHKTAINIQAAYGHSVW